MKSKQGFFAKRTLLVGLVAGSGILAASAFAMPEQGAAGKPGCEARHGHKVHGNWEDRRAEHLAALKEKLKLAPEQEAAWETFVAASSSGMRHTQGDSAAMRDAFEKLSTPQRLDKMLERSEVRRARMAERAAAVKAFYGQLTPEQQEVFDAQVMPGHHGAHQAHRRHT